MEKPCPIARECGACARIHTPYDQQLAAKQALVEELFDDVADEACVLSPIAGMDDPWRFRNKIASPFAPAKRRGRAKAGGPAILCGMYAPGTHRIVEVVSCPVEHECGRRIVQAVRGIMRKHGMQAYDEDAQTGFVRYVLVRVAHASGEVLVTVVTAQREFPGAKGFARELVRRCPEVTTVVQNVNGRATNAILGSEEHVLYGPGFIIDQLCGLSFRISSQSFYQVNPQQADVLYHRAVELAGGTGQGAGSAVEPLIVDAYCGTGTIGLVDAAAFPHARIVGVEKVASAVKDARQNAAHNGIQNAEFHAQDAGEYLARLAAEGCVPDVLFLDPPRAGASEQFLQAVAACKPQRVVYISCNPHTQVRDVRMLVKAGYRLSHI